MHLCTGIPLWNEGSQASKSYTKEVVDPNYSPIATTRSCNCIGNNRPKTKPVQEEDDSGVVQRVKS
eukprot:scaffold2971_cov152-Skeletonema_menzelii.AAC.13